MATSKFRPCIDLHNGMVKQIIGGTLSDDGRRPSENFVSERSAAFYAEKFREDELNGGHVIQLGGGNEEAARSALATWDGGLQLGGGVRRENAAKWLEAGASHVIVTSWLFDEDGIFCFDRLTQLASEIGRENLVIDLSCRREADQWVVAMNRWQTKTNLYVEHDVLSELSAYCDEFLVHAADVEGLCSGMDEELVDYLGQWQGCPITYAGGIISHREIESLERRSRGRIDYTVGSALDLFGGEKLKYDELVSRNRD